MATAGYNFTISVSATSGGTYSEVPSTDGLRSLDGHDRAL